MIKRAYPVAAVFALPFVGVAGAQEYTLMNMIADRVIQKYQQASCGQLWKRKGKKTDEEQNLIHCCATIPRCAQRSSTK
jgi:hypothetical protein